MFNLEQARGILQQYADVGSFILSQGLMPDAAGKYVLCCEYFAIQEIEDRNAIRKYAEGGFQDVEERLNRPGNRKWNVGTERLAERETNYTGGVRTILPGHRPGEQIGHLN